MSTLRVQEVPGKEFHKCRSDKPVSELEEERPGLILRSIDNNPYLNLLPKSDNNPNLMGFTYLMVKV